MNQITITVLENNNYLAKIELANVLQTLTNDKVTINNIQEKRVTNSNIRDNIKAIKTDKIKNTKPRKYLDANIIYETKNMSEEEWSKARKEGIGGSDASSVVGANPYKSAINVYMDKTETIDEYENINNLNENKKFKMDLGTKLEDFVAREFTLKTGKRVRNINGILRNDKYLFAIANIDKAVVGEKAFLECIVTNSFVKKEWIKEVPMHYKIQCYHYMAVTGATHCYVAALIGNEELVIHRLEKDESIIENIMRIEESFWEDCILGDVIPLPDGSEDYSNYLNNKYRDSKNETLVLFEKESILQEYDELSKTIKQYEKEKKAIEQYLKDQIQDYEIAFVGDRKITWKTQSRNTIDTKLLKQDYPEIANKYMKTTTSRVFRI